MSQFEQLFALSCCTCRDENEPTPDRTYMVCRDTVHLMCWYVERKLSPGVEREIERHLNRCRDCRFVLEAATKTLDKHFGTGRAARAALRPAC